MLAPFVLGVRTVIDKLTVLNPLAKLPDQESAGRAARAGAVGLWLTAAGSVIGAASILLRFDTYLAKMREAAAAKAVHQDPAVAEAVMRSIGPGLAWTTIGLAAVVALIYAWLGLVQWRRQTRLIPLLMLLLALYGLLATLTGLLSGQTAGLVPPFQMALSLTLSLLALLCFIAGTRGGFRLHALRKAA